MIADAGLTIDHLQALRREQGRTLWEITLEMDEEADRSLYGRIDALPVARFVGKSDRVFDRHRGGKIRTESAIPITTQQVLRDIYTPGVARVCLAIHKDPALAWEYTSLGNTVAIVTNGTAVLGLGNIGALAGLPVMEGKAALFSTLVGINAVPILLDETEPGALHRPHRGDRRGIRRDPARGFRGARLLRDRGGAAARGSTEPVLHDDQHCTAVVVLAAALNATRRAGSGSRRLRRRPDRSRRRRHRHRAAPAARGRAPRARHGPRPGAMQRLAGMGGEPASLDEIMKKADIVIATTGVRGLIQPGDGAARARSSWRCRIRTRRSSRPMRSPSGRRDRRGRQGHQQRAGFPGPVQGRARRARDALHGRDAARGGRSDRGTRRGEKTWCPTRSTGRCTRRWRRAVSRSSRSAAS